MRSITDYLYEAYGNPTSEKSYTSQLNELVSKYTKKRDKANKDFESGKHRSHRYYMGLASEPSDVLAAYPLEIIIDKTDYRPSREIVTPTDRKVVKKQYGAWLADKLDKGELDIESLSKWWKEYEDEKFKKNWHDSMWLFKNLDMNRLWNVYDPKSNYEIDKMIMEPARMLRLLDSKSAKTSYWSLSQDERQELENYYADPANQERISKDLRKKAKSLEKYRPTFKQSILTKLKNFFEDSVYVNGERYDLKKKLEDERRPRSYYQGANDRDEYGHAIYSLAVNALCKEYGVSNIYDYVTWPDDGYEAKHEFSLNTNPDTEEYMSDNLRNTDVYIKDLGTSKDSGESSDVHSSSFTTTYKHDFQVTLKVNGEVKSDETVRGVTVASYFYSGGWD